MKHWVVQHAGAPTSHHMTHGDDPAAEGIDLGVQHHELPARLAPYESWDWPTQDVVTDLAAMDGHLLSLVDAERSRRSKPLLEVDEPRRWEYIRKGVEAISDVGPWLWLTALAEEKGTTVEDERLAVLVAMDATEAALRGISAAALAAKAAIRAATTKSAKLEAFNAFMGDDA